MAEPPIPLEEIYSRLIAAVDSLEGEAAEGLMQELAAQMPAWLEAHWKMLHSSPSPSRITSCRLQQWYRAKGFPHDQEIPTYWKVRAAMGVAAEPYYLAVLTAAGLGVWLPTEAFPIGPMLAHPDLLAPDFAVELKTTNGWGYKALLENPAGVVAEEFGHFAQSQLQAAAADRRWSLYITTPADPSMLQGIMRQRKEYGPLWELPPFYIEWIERNDNEVARLLERAEMLVKDLASDVPPTPEFDGVEFEPKKGRRAYPCGYCLWRTRRNQDFPDKETV